MSGVTVEVAKRLHKLGSTVGGEMVRVQHLAQKVNELTRKNRQLEFALEEAYNRIDDLEEEMSSLSKRLDRIIGRK